MIMRVKSKKDILCIVDIADHVAALMTLRGRVAHYLNIQLVALLCVELLAKNIGDLLTSL